MGLVGPPPCAGPGTWPRAGAGAQPCLEGTLKRACVEGLVALKGTMLAEKGLWHETGLCTPRSPDTRGREPTFSGRHPILRSANPAWVLRARGGRKGARRGWTFLSAGFRALSERLR